MDKKFMYHENPNNIVIVPTEQSVPNINETTYYYDNSCLPVTEQSFTDNVILPGVPRVQPQPRSDFVIPNGILHPEGVDAYNTDFGNEPYVPFSIDEQHQITPSCSEYGYYSQQFNCHRDLVDLSEISSNTNYNITPTTFVGSADYNIDNLTTIEKEGLQKDKGQRYGDINTESKNKLSTTLMSDSYYTKISNNEHKIIEQKEKQQNCAGLDISQPSIKDRETTAINNKREQNLAHEPLTGLDTLIDLSKSKNVSIDKMDSFTKCKDVKEELNYLNNNQDKKVTKLDALNNAKEDKQTNCTELNSSKTCINEKDKNKKQKIIIKSKTNTYDKEYSARSASEPKRTSKRSSHSADVSEDCDGKKRKLSRSKDIHSLNKEYQHEGSKLNQDVIDRDPLSTRKSIKKVNFLQRYLEYQRFLQNYHKKKEERFIDIRRKFDEKAIKSSKYVGKDEKSIVKSIRDIEQTKGKEQSKVVVNSKAEQKETKENLGKKIKKIDREEREEKLIEKSAKLLERKEKKEEHKKKSTCKNSKKEVNVSKYLIQKKNKENAKGKTANIIDNSSQSKEESKRMLRYEEKERAKIRADRLRKKAENLTKYLQLQKKRNKIKEKEINRVDRKKYKEECDENLIKRSQKRGKFKEFNDKIPNHLDNQKEPTKNIVEQKQITERSKFRRIKNLQEQDSEEELPTATSRSLNTDDINLKSIARTVNVSTNLSRPVSIVSPINEMDLRAVLTRKRTNNQYYDKSKSVKTRTPQRENLLITVKQDVNPDPEPNSLKVSQNKSKPKVKKSKKIKLVINIVCPNSGDSADSDDSSISRNLSPQQDLSFLDDFNVDEIVDSLNVTTPIDENNISWKESFDQKINIKDELNTPHETCKIKGEHIVNKVSVKKEEPTKGLISSGSNCNDGRLKYEATIKEDRHTAKLEKVETDTNIDGGFSACYDDDVYEVIDITDDAENTIISLIDDTTDLLPSNPGVRDQQLPNLFNGSENLKKSEIMTKCSPIIHNIDEVFIVDDVKDEEEILSKTEYRNNTNNEKQKPRSMAFIQYNEQNKKHVNDRTYKEIENMLSKITHENTDSDVSMKINNVIGITGVKPKNVSIAQKAIQDNNIKNSSLAKYDDTTESLNTSVLKPHDNSLQVAVNGNTTIANKHLRKIEHRNNPIDKTATIEKVLKGSGKPSDTVQPKLNALKNNNISDTKQLGKVVNNTKSTNARKSKTSNDTTDQNLKTTNVHSTKTKVTLKPVATHSVFSEKAISDNVQNKEIANLIQIKETDNNGEKQGDIIKPKFNTHKGIPDTKQLINNTNTTNMKMSTDTTEQNKKSCIKTTNVKSTKTVTFKTSVTLNVTSEDIVQNKEIVNPVPTKETHNNGEKQSDIIQLKLNPDKDNNIPDTKQLEKVANNTKTTNVRMSKTSNDVHKQNANPIPIIKSNQSKTKVTSKIGESQDISSVKGVSNVVQNKEIVKPIQTKETDNMVEKEGEDIKTKCTDKVTNVSDIKQLQKVAINISKTTNERSTDVTGQNTKPSLQATNVQLTKEEVASKAGVSQNVTSEETVSNVVQNRDIVNLTQTKEIPLDPKYAPIIKSIENRMLACLNTEMTIKTLIHRGHFSIIYKCEDTTGTTFALKILRAKLKFAKRYKGNILTELPIISKSCCILEIINHFKSAGRFCFLSPYYPKTLAEALERNKRGFHIDLVKTLSRQLVAAVRTLTNNRIIHSDISSAHILLSHKNDQLKLCGFDRANFDYRIDHLTPSLSTPAYRAPEIILGYKISFAIDIWSTALVMFEMATGQKLFAGYYNSDILYQQLNALGPLDYEMLQESFYRDLHFHGMKFKRYINSKKWIYVLFTGTNDKLRYDLFLAYNRDWKWERTSWQINQDLKKMQMLYNLLTQMLVLNPMQRLPICFVGASEFIDDIILT